MSVALFVSRRGLARGGDEADRLLATNTGHSNERTSMFKVTWTTSQRIHATIDERTTICGHVFDGPNRSVHGQLHKFKRKRHCRTCFVKKPDFKAPWLPACEADTD